MDAAPPSLRTSPAAMLRASDPHLVGPPPSRDPTLRRMRPGVYTRRSAWEALPPWERYLVRVHAFAMIREDAVFSHESAASLLGLPTFGHPRTIHLFDGRRTRSTTYGDVTVHTSADARPALHADGIRTTTVDDTVIDLVRVLPPALGVAVADAAARSFGVTAQGMLDRAAAQRNAFGRRRMTWALERATPLAESPGESTSRAVIEWCGFAPPLLQREHHVDGRTYRSDFCWPEDGVIGESDGWLKYSEHSATDAAATVRAEKRREDALRRAGWRIARWDYAGAVGVEGLRTALTAAGLKPERRPAGAALASVARNPRSA